MKEVLLVVAILLVLGSIGSWRRRRRARQIQKIMDKTGMHRLAATQQWYKDRGKKPPVLKRSAFQERLEEMARNRKK